MHSKVGDTEIFFFNETCLLFAPACPLNVTGLNQEETSFLPYLIFIIVTERPSTDILGYFLVICFLKFFVKL